MPKSNENFDLSGKEPRFLLSVASLHGIPDATGQEVAFFGASNVGKSSLINALCNRRVLAKTSKTPGRTQLINFFFLPPKSVLVDLPGYGFANVPLKIRQNWQDLLVGYLESRGSLLRAYLLVDSRRFFKDNDWDMMRLFQRFGVVYRVVITKMDKLNVGERAALEKRLSERFGADEIIITSTKSKAGIENLKRDINAWAEV
jgi:GTP-binding protein